MALIENKKFHDEEIIGLHHSDNNLRLNLSHDTLLLEEIAYFELSSFDYQNVIFELNIYTLDTVPPFIEEEYKWIRNYSSTDGLKLLHIDSSTGLHGVVLFSKITLIGEISPIDR